MAMQSGIFGPGGNGGGVFQTGVSGLGEIPASCWDTPGFKNCQAEMLGNAFNICKFSGLTEGTSEWNDCYKKNSDDLIQKKCVSALCATKPATKAVAPVNTKAVIPPTLPATLPPDLYRSPSSDLAKKLLWVGAGVLAVSAGYYTYTKVLRK